MTLNWVALELIGMFSGLESVGLLILFGCSTRSLPPSRNHKNTPHTAQLTHYSVDSQLYGYCTALKLFHLRAELVRFLIWLIVRGYLRSNSAASEQNERDIRRPQETATSHRIQSSSSRTLIPSNDFLRLCPAESLSIPHALKVAHRISSIPILR